MNVVSTGWSANWNPFTGKVTQSNPWGVTATQIMNVERGRYYNLSFKIKSTLSNELTKTVERADGTAYNEGTGKYNYVKHVHFKVFDNNDKDGALYIYNYAPHRSEWYTAAILSELTRIQTKDEISVQDFSSGIPVPRGTSGKCSSGRFRPENPLSP